MRHKFLRSVFTPDSQIIIIPSLFSWKTHELKFSDKKEQTYLVGKGAARDTLLIVISNWVEFQVGIPNYQIQEQLTDKLRTSALKNP